MSGKSFIDGVADTVSTTATSIYGGMTKAVDAVGDFFTDNAGITGPFAPGSSRTLGPLDEFVNHIKKTGVARPNRFRVTIPLPEKVMKAVDPDSIENASDGVLKGIVKVVSSTSVKGGRVTAARSLQIMCQIASFPGTNVDTSEIKSGGKPRKIAYGLSYDVADFAFLVSNEMKEKKVFDYWVKTIVNPKTGHVGFYDDYIVDVTIEQLDEWNRVTHVVILEEAYPVAVTPIDLDMSSTNVASMLRVGFVYRRQSLGSEEVVTKTASGAPESADDSLLGGFLDGFRPTQIIRDVLNGDLAGAATKAADLYMDAVTGNWSEEVNGIYKVISDVSRKYSGLGARELETIYNVIKGDIAKNGKISQSDKAELMRVITGVAGQVRKVGGAPTATNSPRSTPLPSGPEYWSAKAQALQDLL